MGQLVTEKQCLLFGCSAGTPLADPELSHKSGEPP